MSFALSKTQRPLIYVSLLACLAGTAAGQDPRPCLSKVKAWAKGGLQWTTQTTSADYCSTVQLYASRSISNGNGSKYANATSWGRWNQGCVSGRAWFYGGTVSTKKWSAGHDYKFTGNCDAGAQGQSQSGPRPAGGELTADETGVVFTTTLTESATGADVRFDAGAILFLGNQALAAAGERQRATLEIVVTDSRTNTVVFDGSVTLSQTFGTLPRSGLRGHMAGQPVTVAPVTGGVALDLTQVHVSLQCPLEFADITFATSAVGAEGDDGYVESYGAGCPGSNGVPELTASGLPNYGHSYFADLARGAPSSLAALLVGGSSTQWNGIPLPLPLAMLGAPNCSLLTSVDLAFLTPVDPSGRAQIGIAIPNDPSLVDAVLHHQYAVIDFAANPLGLVTTNGLAVTLGGLR